MVQVEAGVAVAGFVGSVPVSSCPTAPLSPRLLQLGQHRWLAGVKRLLLNVSRAVTRDVLIAFSPTAVRYAPPSPLLGRSCTFQTSLSPCPRAWCALLCSFSSLWGCMTGPHQLQHPLARSHVK